MNSTATPPAVRAFDPVARALEEHLHKMESEGLGFLVVDRDGCAVRLTFGNLRVRAETYDVALLRIAGEMLDDPRLGNRFLTRIRGSLDLKSHEVAV